MNYRQELEQSIQSDFTELFTECKRQGVVRFAEFIQVWKQFGMVRVHNYYMPIPGVSKCDFLYLLCDAIMNKFLSNTNISLLMIKVYSVFSVYIISSCAMGDGSSFKVRVNFRNWQVLKKARDFFTFVLDTENTAKIASIGSSNLVKLRYCANDFLKACDYMHRAGTFFFSLSIANNGSLTRDLANFNPTFPKDAFDTAIDQVLVKTGKPMIHPPPLKKTACSSSDVDKNGESEIIVPRKSETEDYFDGDDNDDDDENTLFWQDGFQKEIVGDFTEPCMLNTTNIGKFLSVYCASKDLFIENHGSETGNTRMLNIVDKGYWNTLNEDMAKYLSLRQEVADDVVKYGHTKSGFISAKIVDGIETFVPRAMPASVVPVTVEVKNGTDEHPKARGHPRSLTRLQTDIRKEKDRWSKNPVDREKENPENKRENYVSAIISGDGNFVQRSEFAAAKVYESEKDVNDQGNNGKEKENEHEADKTHSESEAGYGSDGSPYGYASDTYYVDDIDDG